MILLAGGPLCVAAQAQPEQDAAEELAQMQLLLHHAVETAAVAAGLIALGRAKCASAIDSLAADRGRAMVADAKKLIREVAGGSAMMALHARELTDAENAMMIRTHQLEQAASSYIDVLEQSLGPSLEDR
jgi:hypothetical protein